MESDTGVGSGAAEEPDHLILSAACSFPLDPPDRIAAALYAAGLTTRRGDSRRFVTRSATVDTDDYRLRDELLEVAAADLLALLKTAGVSPEIVEECGALVQLYISLSSTSGRPGIQMKPGFLRPWVALGAELRIDVI